MWKDTNIKMQEMRSISKCLSYLLGFSRKLLKKKGGNNILEREAQSTNHEFLFQCKWFEEAQIHFSSDVFIVIAVVVA